MSRRPFFIKLSAEQLKELEEFIKEALVKHKLQLRHRAQGIWYSHCGRQVRQIAEIFKVSERSVWEWLKRYQQKGLAGLRHGGGKSH